jgi:hypothetical protein
MSAPVSHPITLEHVLFVRSVVVANKAFDREQSGPRPTPENSVTAMADPDVPRRYAVVMRTRMGAESEPNCPYTIDMEAIGYFTHDESLSDEVARRGITITANSVVYGAIREAVLAITSRQIHGSLTLGLSVLTPTPAQGLETAAASAAQPAAPGATSP